MLKKRGKTFLDWPLCLDAHEYLLDYFFDPSPCSLSHLKYRSVSIKMCGLFILNDSVFEFGRTEIYFNYTCAASPEVCVRNEFCGLIEAVMSLRHIES